MKKFGKIALKYVIVYFALIAIFLISLTLVSLIPKESIEKHTKESADILYTQTNRLFIPIRNLLIMFDNFTDSLMINTAYSIDNKDAFYSAMMARKNYIPGVTKIIHEDTVGELKSASKYNKLDQAGELKDTVEGNIEESFEYARYWHGYLVFLRPALLITNIGFLRVFMIGIFCTLGLTLSAIIAKKVNILYAISIRTSV